MGRRIVLTFHDDTQSEPFTLSYALLDNAFLERWVTALIVDNPEKRPLSYFASGALFVDEAEERSALDRRIGELESELKVQLAKTPLRKFATTEDFSSLKAICLERLNAPISLRDQNTETRKKISDLIQAIIHYESLYHPDHHFQCDLKIQNDRRYFFKESEYDLFTLDRNDGWLYLDYAQTGLAPIAAYLAQSNELPTPQDSFIGSFQIMYREDFSYSGDEKAAAKAWLHRRLNRSKVEKKDQLGQIPLARPLHSFSRIEVLNKLLGFNGQITLSLWEGERELNAASLKQELKATARSLALYHPYPRFSLGAFYFHVCRYFWPAYSWMLRVWGQRWLIPWSIGHYVYWPLLRTVMALRQNIIKLIYKLRDAVWFFGFKASWPLRKVYYMGKHVITTRLLKKKI